MKQLLLVILLPIMLTACNKTDLFGYESYNHCMLGTVASQPGFKEKNSTLQYAISYCLEKFPHHSFGVTKEESELSADEIVEKYRKQAATEDAMKKTGINNVSNEDIQTLLNMLSPGYERTKKYVLNVKKKINILDEEIEKRIVEGVWDIKEKETWTVVKAPINMTDEELIREAKTLRNEIEKRKSGGLWSITTKAPKDMTNEELFDALYCIS